MLRRIGSHQRPHLSNFVKARWKSTPSNEFPLSSPTWSVRSLLPTADASEGDVVSYEQFQNLHRLANLEIPTSKEEERSLMRDINSLEHFVRHIQELDTTGVEPMRGIWPERISMVLREDEPLSGEGTTEEHGNELLKHAKRVSGNYYVVKSAGGKEA
ncbi:uncharacterized protein VTP21DRAFT_10113 [Calcarisporiella thermophila]|uniref:uncharacterized protein n=1 Tax=Calcarisporiella thermophila TaxID=911321 RepID=UPI0037443DA0